MGYVREREPGNTFTLAPPPSPRLVQNIPWVKSGMSINHKEDALTRSILTRTVNTVKELAVTLDDLLDDEKATLLRLERLKERVKEEERKRESLKNLIEATRLSKGKMEMVVHDLRNFLSPTKTLPAEILIKIFLDTIEQADQDRRLVACKWKWYPADRTPVNLSQVCTRWRHILVLNPYLWRHIHCHYLHMGQDKAAIECFNHYTKLGTSTQQSLSIPNWTITTQNIILGVLNGAPTTYKSIELTTSHDPAGLWDTQALNTHEIFLYRTHQCLTTTYFTPLLQTASKVTIYGSTPQWGTVPWVSLQSLIIRQFCDVDESWVFTFSRDDFVQLLNATPSLTRLELDFEIGETLLVWNEDISMFHTRIKSLSIHLHHFAAGKGLFGIQLNLPALHTLEFLSIHSQFATAYKGDLFSDRLAPAKLLLPELKNYELTLAARVLHWMPSVDCLHITGAHSSMLLLPLHPGYHLQPSVNSAPVPKLKTLHITDSDVDGETLSRFVQARLTLHEVPDAGVSSVEYIRMYNTPGVTVSDWNKIQEMLEVGRVANGVHRASE